MEPVISVRNVNHYFGGGALRRQILFDVSADIFPGEIVIVNGPSGSGKTTLLTLAGALRSVEEGSLTILGRELSNASDQDLIRTRSDIGFIFQAHNLLSALTARQNVQMSLGIEFGLSAAEARRRSEDALEAVGLGDYFEVRPGKLSGGQRQRVAIARALVRHPKIILADEPTAALDKQTGRDVVELIQRLAKQQGCAILLVTHDNRILDVADRILTLEDGRITSFVAGLAASTGQLLSAFAKLQQKGDLVRHVSRMSSKQFLTVLDGMTTEFEGFLGTLDLANEQAIHAMLDQILAAVVLKIRELLRAERGTIFLVDHQRGQLRSKIAESDDAKPLEITLPISSGIAGNVARTGQTLNISDPYSRPDFNREVDQRTGYVTRNILCMPILDRSKNVIAVAQLLNKLDQPSFSTADEETFRDFATPLGLILESCNRMTQFRGAAAG